MVNVKYMDRGFFIVDAWILNYFLLLVIVESCIDPLLLQQLVSELLYLTLNLYFRNFWVFFESTHFEEISSTNTC